MDNISYTIIDTSRTGASTAGTDTHSDPITAEFDINLYNLDEEVDALRYNDLCALYTTYTLKSLVQIMTYYKLNPYNSQKKRLLKEEIILLLIMFELDFSNQDIVLKRLRLWENIAELSADNYFKSFITFTV